MVPHVPEPLHGPYDWLFVAVSVDRFDDATMAERVSCGPGVNRLIMSLGTAGKFDQAKFYFLST